MRNKRHFFTMSPDLKHVDFCKINYREYAKVGAIIKNKGILG